MYAQVLSGLVFGGPIMMAGAIIALAFKEVYEIEAKMEMENEKKKTEKRPCPECDGTGFDSSIDDTCLACEGSGIYSGKDWEYEVDPNKDIDSMKDNIDTLAPALRPGW